MADDEENTGEVQASAHTVENKGEAPQIYYDARGTQYTVEPGQKRENAMLDDNTVKRLRKAGLLIDGEGIGDDETEAMHQAPSGVYVEGEDPNMGEGEAEAEAEEGGEEEEGSQRRRGRRKR